MVGDLGHSPASNKENTDHAFNEEGARFFEAKLQHTGTAPASGGVTAYTQTCPVTAPGAGPFLASEWSKLHPHTVTFGSSSPQSSHPPGATRRSPRARPDPPRGGARKRWSPARR